MKIRCAIIGGSGYTGSELLRLLSLHPHVEITCVTSRTQAGTPIPQLFPHLTGFTDLAFEAPDTEKISKKAQIAFTAVPHQAAMKVVRELIEMGVRVIDLSADFRLQSHETYEKWYGPHSEKELLKEAVYGLPEIYRDLIKNAKLLANPGCYPTSAILPLFPFLKEGIVQPEYIVVDSKSGVSGAGRSGSVGLNFSEVNEGFKAYKVGTHRHTPEIEQELSKAAGVKLKINFTPHLVPMTRGILTTSYAKLKKEVDTDATLELLRDHYSHGPFVKVLPKGVFPDCHFVRGGNFIHIGAKVDKRTNTLILVSAIDNLVKGASGQAIQNMNIMTGLEETTGLEAPPLFP